MSIIATAVRHLLAAGVTGEALISAIADMESATPRPVDVVAEKRRTYDRERKRKTARVSTGNPPESADQSPPIDNTHTPPQTISSEIVTKPRKTTNAHQMPEGWEPVLTPAAQRVADGWPPGFYERTLSGFRNHAADKGRKSKDWQAAFRTWIDNADKWKPKNDKPTASNDEPQNPYVRAVARREAERAAAEWG